MDMPAMTKRNCSAHAHVRIGERIASLDCLRVAPPIARKSRSAGVIPAPFQTVDSRS
jgi:hypothetical protein